MLLQGLWAGGNMLRELPTALGQLTALRALSLAGNRLTSLPASLSALTVGSDCVSFVVLFWVFKFFCAVESELRGLFSVASLE